MSDHDRHFFDTFMLVLGALVGFTIAIYVLANYIGGRTQVQWMANLPEAQAKVIKRIEPVGQVAVAGETPAAAETPAGGPAPEAQVAAAGTGPGGTADISGEQIYASSCFACHAIGAAGAPKLGDTADWAPRLAQGLDVLKAHAINGYQGSKGVMPAKGGYMNLSDAEVGAAVEYMVSEAE